MRSRFATHGLARRSSVGAQGNGQQNDRAGTRASQPPFWLDLAVANASLRIEAGEMVGIIGRSGAGKSTLAAPDQPADRTDRGRRSGCDGADITALRGTALRRWRARTAMIFQQFNLVPPAGRADQRAVRPAAPTSGRPHAVQAVHAKRNGRWRSARWIGWDLAESQ